MSAPYSSSRLQALVSRMCDGDISLPEMEELSTMLDGNDPAAREYMEYTALHYHLGRQFRAVTHAASVSDHDHSLTDRPSTHPPISPRTQSEIAWRRWLAVPIVAASLLLAFAVLQRADDSQPDYIARIVSAVNCEWDESRWASPQTITLDAGHAIKINQGLLTLEFGDGAEVTLEAPVRFVVLAEDRGRLEFGKLTAMVPDRAHGFAVETPTSTIVDLGTNFGATVAEDGSSETHVFEGSVVVRREMGDQLPEEWTLTAGSALRIEMSAIGAKEFNARPEAFVHSTKFSDPITTVDSGLVRVPPDGALVLWLDAAQRMQLDGARRVVAWGDVRTAENDVADNAWQVNAKLRPTWVPDAFGDRPAVKFDGLSHLVTTPFVTASDVTVAAVIRVPANPSRNGTSRQIVNFNGPPNLVLEHSPQNRIAGKLTSTLDDPDSSRTGRLESSLPEAEVPVVVVYAYGHSSDKSLLYVNGELAGKGQASLVSEIRSPKFIGTSNAVRDSFVGDLGELLVFNSVLSPEQCTHISADLMAKYAINKDEREPRILLKILPE